MSDNLFQSACVKGPDGAQAARTNLDETIVAADVDTAAELATLLSATNAAINDIYSILRNVGIIKPTG